MATVWPSSLMMSIDTSRVGLSTSNTATKWTFPPLDGWIRRRLRSILRTQQATKGSAVAMDHHRWPNKFFRDHGLFSLVDAHRALLQSSRGKTTDRRAGCGRSASPVRREGRCKPMRRPYPYSPCSNKRGIWAGGTFGSSPRAGTLSGRVGTNRFTSSWAGRLVPWRSTA